MFRSVPGEAGQATVEFALVVPLVALTLLGIFDLGRVVWAQSALENAVHEVARFAIVHGGTYMTTCPVGPDDLQRSCAGGGSPSTGGGWPTYYIQEHYGFSTGVAGNIVWAWIFTIPASAFRSLVPKSPTTSSFFVSSASCPSKSACVR